MWVVEQGKIVTFAVVGVTMGNDVGAVIGTINMARFQLLYLEGGNILGLCVEIGKVNIPIKLVWH